MFEPTCFQFLRHGDSPQFSQPDEMARTFQRFMDLGDVNGAMQSFVDVWAKRPGSWAALPEAVKNAVKFSAHRTYFEWDLIYLDTPTLGDVEALNIPLMLFKGSEKIDSMHEVCRIMSTGLPCVFVEVEGAGHISPFTHADRVAPEVGNFITTHTGNR